MTIRFRSLSPEKESGVSRFGIGAFVSRLWVVVGSAGVVNHRKGQFSPWTRKDASSGRRRASAANPPGIQEYPNTLLEYFGLTPKNPLPGTGGRGSCYTKEAMPGQPKTPGRILTRDSVEDAVLRRGWTAAPPVIEVGSLRPRNSEIEPGPWAVATLPGSAVRRELPEVLEPRSPGPLWK